MYHLAIYATPAVDTIPYFSRWIEYLSVDELITKDWRGIKPTDVNIITDLYNTSINIDIANCTDVNIINGVYYRFIIGSTREAIIDFCMQDMQIEDTTFCNIIS